MTCMEAQSLITPFINDQLDMATLEAFLEHIKHCKECREELEVYYALLTAMQLLDEDKEVSDDFSKQLNMKIQYSEEKIRKSRYSRIRKRFYLIFITLGFVVISSIQVGTEVFITEPPKKASFLLKYTGIPDRYHYTQKVIYEYDSKAKEYVKLQRQNQRIIYEQLKKESFHWKIKEKE